MNIKIPGQSKIIKQDNRSSLLGSIVESFNLDLRSDVGKIKVTKTKKVGDFTTYFGVTTPINYIGQNNGIPFFFGLNTITDSIYQGDGSTFYSSTFTRDTSSADYDADTSDMTCNNGFYYASSNTSFSYTPISSFGIWTNVASPALDDSTPHLLAGFGNKTYITNLNYKIGSIDSSNVLSLTGTSTLNLGMSGYTITVLMSGLDRLWIGLSSLQQGQLGTTYIYEWDGESENTPSQRYEIDASGLICGVVKDGIPYVLDTNGRLLAYAGSRFVEVAKLPYKEGEIMSGFNSSDFSTRAIHPRAITVDGDEILINVSNMLHGSTATSKIFADFPSGVWAYHPDHGLYHKYSASNQPADDNGSTNLVSHGEMVVNQAGGIFVHDPIVSFETAGEGGRVVFACRYFTTGDDDTETADVDVTYKTAIFASDVRNDSQKFGYFITSEIQTQSVTEAWKKVYVLYKNLLDSSDKITVKYRTEKAEDTKATVEWLDTYKIVTSTNLSAYSQGDEMQVLFGYGAGKSFTIDTINVSGGNYVVTFTETVPSSFVNKSAGAKFTNFKTLGTITQNDNRQWKGFTLPDMNISPMVQFKVCMQFTGDDELYGIEGKTATLIKE